jgi:hypothetical protein
MTYGAASSASSAFDHRVPSSLQSTATVILTTAPRASLQNSAIMLGGAFGKSTRRLNEVIPGRA